MEQYALSVDRLTVGYQSPLISEICFQVKKGQIMTLIGANGSGKSTILKTISGHLKKIGGNVYFDGKSSEDISEKDKARKLSVLLTERVSPELMTCRDVVETGRYPYTGHFGRLSQKDHEAVQNAMELVEIEAFAENDFLQISDGQRQRVLLAKAICQEPDILILDEPTSFLDIHHKILFLETVRKLALEKQIAIIVSMHELELAEKISDYTVCVKDGKITHMGKPDNIFQAAVICKLFDISEENYHKYLL